MTSIGEALVQLLEEHGVEIVFGIPGVHTIELYRGLGDSRIRHVTARHEQGAGFMADGYARVSGKPGVAFVITGPGLTNILTPMAQARADSVPMLVISGVNARNDLGRGLGHLHELADQQKMAATVALASIQVGEAGDLAPALDRAFRAFTARRGGPIHIEIPIDVMDLPFVPVPRPATAELTTHQSLDRKTNCEIDRAASILTRARAPAILLGGGARWSESAVTALAERLDAPVIQTVNARGVLHGHPLAVPASPSLGATRDLIAGSDAILALGTELGPTDYDMYRDNGLPDMPDMIRVDISADQLARHPATVNIHAPVADVASTLLEMLGAKSAQNAGARRANATRLAAQGELSAPMRAQLHLLDTIRKTVPNAIIVGDSTQLIYTGNLYYDHDRPGGWFNAATGYGALGYAIPAAIGAALAEPAARVICITGDGGAQFTLPELMTAADETLPILFLIWNSDGYQEIETSMLAAGVSVIGCNPTPPDFGKIAEACGMPYQCCEADSGALAEALRGAALLRGPSVIEIAATTRPQNDQPRL